MNLGATGHQKLAADVDWQWVEQAVFEETASLAPPICGVTCLAAGADHLVSRAVLAVGGQIHALIPFAGIERTFSAQDLVAYEELVGQASVEVL